MVEVITKRPIVVVVGGPNGAGKSTSAPHLIRDLLGINTYVNADLIADGLAGFSPEQVGLKAGRIMLERLEELGKKGDSFAFETTLAGKNYAKFLKGLKSRHKYLAHLLFLWLPSPEQALSRVRDRVSRGGHSIPEDVIIRRYQRGLQNFFKIYEPIVDSWTFLDNSDPEGPQTIAYKHHHEKPIIVDFSQWAGLRKQLMIDDRDHIPNAVKEEQTRYGTTEIVTPGPDEILEAVRKGYIQAVREHRAFGQPMVFWKDGKVVWVPADELPDV
jgi:predicted ABC-type ATPase